MVRFLKSKDKNLRVLIVGMFPDEANAVYTGPMRAVHHLARALSSRENVDTTLLTAYRMRHWSKPTEIRREGDLRVVHTSYAGLLRTMRLRSDVDVINIHGVSLFNWMAGSRHLHSHPAAVLYTAHGVVPFERRYGFRHSRFKAFLEKRLVNGCDHLITVSEGTRQLLVDTYGISQNRIAVIGNGVDTDFFRPKRPSISSKEKTVQMVCVGTITPIKGLDFLLQAMKRLRNHGVKLQLIGSPTDYLQELRRIHADLFQSGTVEYAGTKNQEELLDAYASADIFVLTSQYDQYPQAVLEAFAMGKPAVISDRVGVKAIVRNGEEGFVVPYGDVDALARQIRYLADQPKVRAAMGKKARLLAEKNSWNCVSETYLRLYRRFSRLNQARFSQ